MVNSLRRSLHTNLPPSLKFSFQLTPELFNTVFLTKVHMVDLAGSIALNVFVFYLYFFLLHSIDNTSIVQ